MKKNYFKKIYNTASFTLVILLLSVSITFLAGISETPLTQEVNASGINFAASYGGSNSDKINVVKPTDDGGFITVGSTSSFGAGQSDVFVQKLDNKGQLIWHKTYGGSSYDYGNSIDKTNDGGYIVMAETSSFGAGQSDIWVIKIDGDGEVSWQKAYGGSNYEYCYSNIEQTSDGGYIFSGGTQSFEGQYPGQEVWVVKIDSSGNIQWQKKLGDGGSDTSKDDYAHSVSQTSDGGYVIAGYTDAFGTNVDAWIIKLDSAGNVTWQKTYGGAQMDYATSAQQTSDGGYIAACYTYSFGSGLDDIWILKLDAAGNITWQKTYGGANSEQISTIKEISGGGYIVSGDSYSFSGDGYNDSVLFEIDNAGLLVWQYTFGGSNFDTTYWAEESNDGGFIAAGYTYSYSVGNKDGLIIKTDQNGQISGCEPACTLARSSNLQVSNTSVSGANTSAIVSNTSAVVQPTSILPQDVIPSENYICQPPSTYIIGGTVSYPSMDPLPGINIDFGGYRPGVITQPDGTYSQSEFVNGQYTITPSLPGYSCTPSSIVVNVNNSDSLNNDFVCEGITYDISGTVKDPGDNPLSGVNIDFGGNRPSVLTQANGTYSQSGFVNGQYTVTPALSGHSCTPASSTVDINNSNSTFNDFICEEVTYSIGGDISFIASSDPIEGVTVDFGGIRPSVVTQSDGTYLQNSFVNGTYTITPTKSGLNFQPINQQVNINNADELSVQFSGEFIAPVMHQVQPVPGESDFTVSWDAVDGAGAYELWECDNDQCLPTFSLAFNASMTSYNMWSKDVGSYFYKVRACETLTPNNCGQWSTIEQGIVSLALNQIENADGDGNYTIEWHGVSGREQYEVQEADSPDFLGQVTTIPWNDSDALASMDKLNMSEGTYYYRVRDCDSNWLNCGGWSNVEFVVVSPPLSKPVLAITPDLPFENEDYTVSWTSVNNATEYRLRLGTSSAFNQVYVGGQTSFSVTGHTGGTYYYKVTACREYEAGQYVCKDSDLISRDIGNMAIQNLRVESWDFINTDAITQLPEFPPVNDARYTGSYEVRWLNNIDCDYDEVHSFLFNCGGDLSTWFYDRMASRILSLFSAEKSGIYNFAISGDDGFKMKIDGNVVVEDNRQRGMAEPDATGSITLGQGWHEFEVHYFEDLGGNGLILKYQDPDMIDYEVIPPTLFAPSVVWEAKWISQSDNPVLLTVSNNAVVNVEFQNTGTQTWNTNDVFLRRRNGDFNFSCGDGTLNSPVGPGSTGSFSLTLCPGSNGLGSYEQPENYGLWSNSIGTSGDWIGNPTNGSLDGKANAYWHMHVGDRNDYAVVVYKHLYDEYDTPFAVFTNDDPDLSDNYYSDGTVIDNVDGNGLGSITSVKLIGAIDVKLFEHINYDPAGAMTFLAVSDTDLSNDDVGNDSVSSLSIVNSDYQAKWITQTKDFELDNENIVNLGLNEKRILGVTFENTGAETWAEGDVALAVRKDNNDPMLCHQNTEFPGSSIWRDDSENDFGVPTGYEPMYGWFGEYESLASKNLTQVNPGENYTFELSIYANEDQGVTPDTLCDEHFTLTYKDANNEWQWMSGHYETASPDGKANVWWRIKDPLKAIQGFAPSCLSDSSVLYERLDSVDIDGIKLVLNPAGSDEMLWYPKSLSITYFDDGIQDWKPLYDNGENIPLPAALPEMATEMGVPRVNTSKLKFRVTDPDYFEYTNAGYQNFPQTCNFLQNVELYKWEDEDTPSIPVLNNKYGLYYPFEGKKKVWQIWNDNRYSHGNLPSSIDFAGGGRFDLLAAQDGEIVKFKDDSNSEGNGHKFCDRTNYVLLKHTASNGDTFYTSYAHLTYDSVPDFNIGQVVKKGQFIGKAGDTGCSAGVHLHFTVHQSQPNLGSLTPWNNTFASDKYYFIEEPYRQWDKTKGGGYSDADSDNIKTDGASPWDAKWVSQVNGTDAKNHTTLYFKGGKTRVQVTFKNSGTETWQRDIVGLYTQLFTHQVNNQFWQSTYLNNSTDPWYFQCEWAQDTNGNDIIHRIANFKEPVVNPGENATFEFDLCTRSDISLESEHYLVGTGTTTDPENGYTARFWLARENVIQGENPWLGNPAESYDTRDEGVWFPISTTPFQGEWVRQNHEGEGVNVEIAKRGRSIVTVDIKNTAVEANGYWTKEGANKVGIFVKQIESLPSFACEDDGFVTSFSKLVDNFGNIIDNNPQYVLPGETARFEFELCAKESDLVVGQYYTQNFGLGLDSSVWGNDWITATQHEDESGEVGIWYGIDVVEYSSGNCISEPWEAKTSSNTTSYKIHIKAFDSNSFEQISNESINEQEKYNIKVLQDHTKSVWKGLGGVGGGSLQTSTWDFTDSESNTVCKGAFWEVIAYPVDEFGTIDYSKSFYPSVQRTTNGEDVIYVDEPGRYSVRVQTKIQFTETEVSDTVNFTDLGGTANVTQLLYDNPLIHEEFRLDSMADYDSNSLNVYSYGYDKYGMYEILNARIEADFDSETVNVVYLKRYIASVSGSIYTHVSENELSMVPDPNNISDYSKDHDDVGVLLFANTSKVQKVMSDSYVPENQQSVLTYIKDHGDKIDLIFAVIDEFADFSPQTEYALNVIMFALGDMTTADQGKLIVGLALTYLEAPSLLGPLASILIDQILEIMIIENAHAYFREAAYDDLIFEISSKNYSYWELKLINKGSLITNVYLQCDALLTILCDGWPYYINNETINSNGSVITLVPKVRGLNLYRYNLDFMVPLVNFDTTYRKYFVEVSNYNVEHLFFESLSTSGEIFVDDQSMQKGTDIYNIDIVNGTDITYEVQRATLLSLDPVKVVASGEAGAFTLQSAAEINLEGAFSVMTTPEWNGESVNMELELETFEETMAVPFQVAAKLKAEFWDFDDLQMITALPQFPPENDARYLDDYTIRWLEAVNYPNTNGHALVWESGGDLQQVFYDRMVAQITGNFKAEMTGTYKFSMSGDEGFRFIIDGNTVLEDNRQRSMAEPDAMGNLYLTEGWHSIIVHYFEDLGGNGLILKYKDPNMTEYEIVPSRLFAYNPDEVTPNTPPEIISLPITQSGIDAVYSYDIQAADYDDDTLTYNLVDFPNGMIIDTNTGEISWDPLPTDIGDHTVTVEVSDGIDAIEQTYTLSVMDTCSPNPGLQAEFYDLLTYIDFLPDFDTLTPYETRIINTEINYPDTGGEIAESGMSEKVGIRYTGKILIENPGDHTFYVRSDDGSKLYINGNLLIDNDGWHGAIEKSGIINLGQGYHDINLEYFERGGAAALQFMYAEPGGSKITMPSSRFFNGQNCNQPPIIDPIIDQLIDEDTPFQYATSATDNENDPITYYLVEKPEGMTINQNTGIIDWTPDNPYVGAHLVTVGATDGKPGLTESFTLTVNNVNDNPIAVDDYVITHEEQSVNIVPLYNDIDMDDGDIINIFSFDDTSINNGTLIDDGDGTFTYTPDEDYYGPETFTYDINDGNGGTATAAVNITVLNVNDAPVGANDQITVNAVSEHTFTENDFTFNDPDTEDTFAGIQIVSIETAGDMEYMGTDVTAGLEIETSDIPYLMFKPTGDQDGTPYATFTFKIHDSEGMYSEIEYNMTINVTSYNNYNVALNKPITDYYNTDWDPSSVTDGIVHNEGSAWTTSPSVKLIDTSSYVIVDLLAQYDLKLIKLQADDNDRYLIEISTDNVTWSTLANLRVSSGGGFRTRIVDVNETGRYLRISAIAGDASYSVSEIEAYELSYRQCSDKICNSDFEQGWVNYWEKDGTVEIVNDVVYSGGNSAYSEQELLDSQTATWKGIRQYFSITGSQEYDIKALLKWETASHVYMHVNWYDSNHNQIGNGNHVMDGQNGSNDWTGRGTILKAPSNAAYAQIYIRHGIALNSGSPINATGSKIWVDNVSFSPVSVSGIQNGDFETGDPSGWYLKDHVEIVSTEISDYSLYSEQSRSSLEAGTTSGISQFVKVDPSKEYDFRALLKWQDAAEVKMQVNWHRADNSYIYYQEIMSGHDGTSTGWEERGAIIKPYADAAYAWIHIQHGYDNDGVNVPGSKLWIDNVKFDEVIVGQLVNGNFELGDSSGWKTYFEATVIDENGNKVLYSEQSRTPSETSAWSGISQFVKVDPLKEYNFNASLKWQDASEVRMQINWYRSDNSYITYQEIMSGHDGASNDWEERSAVIKPYADAAYAWLYIWHGYDNGVNVPGSKLWIDNVGFDEVVVGQLINGDFESGNSSGWKTYSEATVIDENGNKVLYSEQTRTPSETGTWSGISQFVKVDPSKEYNYKALLKWQDTTEVRMQINWYRTDNSYITYQTTISGINGTSSGWEERGATVTSLADAAYAWLYIWHGYNSGAGENVPGSKLWVDDVKFQENSIAPTITLLEPDGADDIADGSYIITWTDEDPDNNAIVKLFYDTDNTGTDGIQITDCDPIFEDDETDTCLWNTSSVPKGEYYIYGVIDDGINSPLASYSFYPVNVTGKQICPTSMCNGDFESGTDLDYWEAGNGTNQIVTDIVQDGTKAYYTEHMYDAGMNPRWSGISQIVTVESAQTYGLTGFYRSENAAQGHVKVTWKDNSGTVLQVDYPITNINGTNSSWIEFSKLIIAPAGAATAEIRIWHGVNTSAQNVLGSKLWIDSLAFEVATTACGTLCNESFEHGILYWIQSGTAGSHTIEQTGVHEGLKTLKSEQLYTSGDETKWAGITQFAQVKEGTTYRLRTWLKTQNAVNGHVRIRWRDDGGALISTQYPITGIGGTNLTWFKREITVTAPANATKAEIAIWHGVTSVNVPGSTLWIDDITMICLNLCNGGFEDGNVHWETNGINEGELVLADVQEGTQSLKIVQSLDNTYNTQWAGISQRTLVTGGNSYNLSFWLKKENAVQGHVKVKWRDANDQQILQQFPIGGINGTNLTWTQMNTTLTAPANAETVEIFIWHGVDASNENATGSTLYLDNIAFDIVP